MSDRWLFGGVFLLVFGAIGSLAVWADRNTTAFKTACEADGGTFIDARNGMFCIKDKKTECNGSVNGWQNYTFMSLTVLTCHNHFS